jgi:uncharacterized protein
MHYFIDGYNLLFRVLQGGGENLRKEREHITKDLELKINLLELDTTLVFDSQYQPDEGSVSHLRCLKIVFTAVGETADEYILQKIKEASHPTHNLVITSDKKLGWLCRKRLAKVESVEEFIQMLNRRYKNKLREQNSTASQKKESAPLPSSLQVSQKKNDIKPKRQASLQECYDYYLHIFQSEFKALPESSTKSNLNYSKIKRKENAPSPEDQLLTDMERWQKIFEKKSNSQYSD